MDVLGGHDDVELAVLLDHVALANRTGDDSQSCISCLLGPAQARTWSNRWATWGPNQTSARFGPQHTDFAVECQHFAGLRGAAHDGRTSRFRRWWTPARHARPAAVPAGQRRHYRGARGLGSTSRASSRSKPAILQVSPGQRDPSARAPHRDHRRRRRAAPAAICAPRRNSPARSCWRPARSGSSSSPGCSGTASAATCICPNSPCWNGTARTPPMTPSWPTASS